jgi:Ca2+-binding EF-hand superfamily protein
LFKNSKKHKELKNVLATMGREHTQAEIARMIKSIDRDGNGKISLDEFADLLD